MKDMFRLDSKVAVVVGGSGGIGEVCAAALASRGASIVIAARTLSRLEDAQKRIESKVGVQAFAATVDVTSEESINDLEKRVLDKYGTVDILVNAHGINVKVDALEITAAPWDSLFAINVRGTVLACKAFGKTMVKKRSGKIINFSSIRGVRATDGGNTLYGASKGAVNMITRMLAAEWATHNVNVNAIAPSLIMSEMAMKNVSPERREMFLAKSPLKRLAKVEDVAGACVYLASSESDFITGQILYVDGGLTAVG
jgi:gluconate 5-dehydrogenase